MIRGQKSFYSAVVAAMKA